MKGFIEVIRANDKSRECINIDHIISVFGSAIITDGIYDDGRYREARTIETVHTYKELVDILEKAVNQ